MTEKTPSEMYKLIGAMIDSRTGPLDFIRRHITKLEFLETISDPEFESFVKTIAKTPTILDAKKIEENKPLDPRRLQLLTEQLNKFAELCAETAGHREFGWYKQQVEKQPNNQRYLIMCSENIVDTLNQIEREY